MRRVPQFVIGLGAAILAVGAAEACTVSASGVSFGSFGLLNEARYATGEISLDCATGVNFSVELDNGPTGTAPDARQLTSAEDAITYGLYQDSGHSDPWGAGIDARGGTGTGSTQLLHVYGRIPAQTSPKTGTYSDTIMVTVIY